MNMLIFNFDKNELFHFNTKNSYIRYLLNFFKRTEQNLKCGR